MKHIHPLPPIPEQVKQRRAENSHRLVLDEVMRLQREVHGCVYCEALRGQISHLLGLAPPDGPWPSPDQIQAAIDQGRVQFAPVLMTREEAARLYPDRCPHCWKRKTNCDCAVDSSTK